MKIEAAVIGVGDCGDTIRIAVQGKEPDSADWRPLSVHSFKIAITDRNAKAFYIGRRVEIEIKPK